MSDLANPRPTTNPAHVLQEDSPTRVTSYHDNVTLTDEATVLRREIVHALYRCGGGHYGGALSVLDLLLTLYRRVLHLGAPQRLVRDRLILSKGHAAIALYAVLKQLGLIEHALDDYGSFASPLEGHPDMTALPAVDFSTGSLGQGLSVGLGMALALRPVSRHVWVVLGDGETQEGQVWEAAQFAAQRRLDNLHAVVDYNRYQEWGYNPTETGASPPIDHVQEKWAAFGWHVLTADGHSFDQLEATFAEAYRTVMRPSVVIARTVKGKGFKLIESDPQRFHCGSLTREEYESLVGHTANAEVAA